MAVKSACTAKVVFVKILLGLGWNLVSGCRKPGVLGAEHRNPL